MPTRVSMSGYVGKTRNLQARIADHLEHRSISLRRIFFRWTSLHHPQKVLMVHRGNVFVETALTLELMFIHGVDRVRGGKFSQPWLSDAQKREIEMELAYCAENGYQEHCLIYVHSCGTHPQGLGCEWTNKFPPVRLEPLEVHKGRTFCEYVVTLTYMYKYGIEHVRGADRMYRKRDTITALDHCWKCGSPGHSFVQCDARKKEASPRRENCCNLLSWYTFQTIVF